MRQNYQIQISVGVNDLAELRAYALARCLAGGISEEEFTQGEADDAADNVEYWLGWAFDAGTPTACGFQIEDSQVVYEGDHDDENPFHPESPEGRAWDAGDRSSIS